jgi:hypothetical protein
MQFTKNIKDDKIAQKKTEFLYEHPNNIMMDDPASTEEKPLPQINKYTDKQHIMRIVWGDKDYNGYFLRECKEGRRKIKAAEAVFDNDVFE